MGVAKSTLIIGLRDQASKGLGLLGKRLKGFQRDTARMGGMNLGLGGMTKSILALGAGYMTLRGAMSGTIGSAIKFESAMADVKKVVDTTPAGFAKLSDGILEMSKRIPVASSGLANIMASAGQSGIAAKDLLAFTELTAKSAVAFGMSADEAGDRFAKLKNVFGLTQSELVDLANGANHLSNKFAATAGEVLEFTNRAAGAAKGLGHSVAELQALGASMVASGIVPETAARGVNAMATNLSVGGAKVRAAFKAMGISFKDWRKLRDKNGPEAMTRMFETIQKMDKDEAAEVWANLVGKDFSDDFSKLNLKTVVDAYAAMANAADRAGSVAKEFETRAGTTEFALQRLKNNIAAIGVEIGSRFLPSIAAGSERLSDDLASLATSNDDVTDRIRAAWAGLRDGLGAGDIFGGIRGQFEALEDFVFGTYRKLGEDAPPFEKIAASIANERSLVGITEKFRGLGSALRDVVSGDFGALGDLGSSIKELGAALGGLSAASVAAGVAALATIGKGLLSFTTGLALSRIGRVFLMAHAIITLAEALDGVTSIAEGFERLGELSLPTQLIAGAGAFLIAAKTIKTAMATLRGATGVAKGLGKAAKSTGKWGKIIGLGAVGIGSLAALLNDWTADAAEVGPEARDGAPAQPRAKPRPESTKPGSDPNDGRTDIREGLVWAFRNMLASGWIASMVYDDRAKPDRPEQYLGAGTGDPDLAAEIKRFRDVMFGRTGSTETDRAPPTPPIRPMTSTGMEEGRGGAGPFVADPKQVAEEAASLERLISLAQRAGELRSMASPAGTFRGNLLSPDQQGELAGINAEIRTVTDGMPEVRARVQAVIRDIQSGATDAAGAVDQIRQALADAGVRGGQEMQQGVQSGVSGLTAILDGAAARAFASGAKIGGQLAAGIRSRAGEARAAAAEMAQGVADHFPQSPAKVGPLRALVRSGGLIPVQLADGMSRTAPVARQSAVLAGIVSGSLSGLGGATPALAELRSALQVPDVTVSAPAEPGSIGGRAERAATMARRVTMVDAARQAAPAAGPAGGVSITFGDINVQAGSGNAQEIANRTMETIERRLASVPRLRFGDVI
ncbi:phage tail tape measure protein [Acuticoccus sediminis]|uniref:Phage tail tape measure protein n=1 Tax=Acuticoccus sediminis TaxID=2184697 RepID=A0A8B2NXI7_9HYPH|nr:phage tail tape measure protein [Acuticoccus sediminis]RAI01091.1 phage tail tape measure protein [Acuticoccus sediminis]